MKKLKTTIKVTIGEITVDEGYYYINYIYERDGKKKVGVRDGDFDSQSPTQYKKVLENGEAVMLVLQLFI